MRLSSETHRQIEEFLRVYFGDEELRLPPVKVYGGRLGRFVTKALNIGAITIGNHIVVSPNLCARDASGQVKVPGWLLAHECTHVMQYARAGLLGFLVSYLSEYFKTLRTTKNFDARARNDAYRAIRHEREAREAEEEYAKWRAARAAEGVAEAIGEDASAQLRPL